MQISFSRQLTERLKEMNWKLHDFASETLLVDHLFNLIIVIWFFKPAHLLKMRKSTAGHVTKTWFFKIMNNHFLTQVLHLNLKENVEKMMW